MNKQNNKFLYVLAGFALGAIVTAVGFSMSGNNLQGNIQNVSISKLTPTMTATEAAKNIKNIKINLPQTVQTTIDFSINSTQQSISYGYKPVNDAVIGKIKVKNNTGTVASIKNLILQASVDCNGSGTFSMSGTADTATYCPEETVGTLASDLVNAVALYNESGTDRISNYSNIGNDGQVNFNSVQITLQNGEEKTFVVKGVLSGSGPFGSKRDRIKMHLLSPNNVYAMDVNADQIPSTYINVQGAANLGNQDGGFYTYFSANEQQ
jgi:hypothetical protein